jgi:nucleoside-diphosphate-sugar epimerase
MTDVRARLAVVFGGAGFIGSRITQALCEAGWRVTVIDGFLPRTGATRANLSGCLNDIQLIASRAEDVAGLAELVENAIVVDAMGWTRHREASEDPAYDLALNVASHLPVVRAIRDGRPKLVFFLGSRHQYGRVLAARINEDTPLAAVDVHSVHKIAAELHYRLVTNAPVISLRFGNTFGPGQPMTGDDIGLIGGFIRTLLEKKPVRLFARSRRMPASRLTMSPDTT